MAYARGKYAKAISDRSGMAFKYNEMVKEWNGSFVHKSEFEPKHPQIRRKHIKADAIALANARPRPKDDNKEFILYITSGFFVKNGDTGINSGASMRVSDSDNILGTKLTAVDITTSIGSVDVVIS
jgi:hypothetical protein|tara:strand:+ start:381 stop:758 length:378 start_codon:yes stop_codon:yes gene_type:complete